MDLARLNEFGQFFAPPQRVLDGDGAVGKGKGVPSRGENGQSHGLCAIVHGQELLAQVELKIFKTSQ